jgi:predicted ATPase/tetratricopeptide (TPR) repeat protein/DNA-binding XRE family transcriptional regulator
VTVTSAPAFGDLLKKYRLAAGVTQEHLAERARVSANAISSLERGARRAPHRDTVALLATALRLSCDERQAFEDAAENVRVRHAPLNLPAQLTPLVGRESDLTRVLDLLQTHRLLTITGAGGIGKTRLAIAAAQQFATVRNLAAWFVDLAALRRSADVAGKIAEAVGAGSSSSDDPVDALVASLKLHEGLILLDNCEHVLDEAARVAAVIAQSRRECVVLATSRERLAIAGERVYRLDPLVPAAALELFEMRAAGVTAGFALTDQSKEIAADICGEVDRIPLAIELAAARVPFLGLGELRARLRGQLAVLARGPRDAPARQQTMHDTVAWSYALLDSAERSLFRRLAVFAGGFYLNAIEPVALSAPLDEAALLPAFSSLVEKSLVVADLNTTPVRYRLLEPIRAFARAQLEAAGELAASFQRHALWAAQITEKGRDDVGLFAREVDNVRAALERTLGRDMDANLGARIAGGAGGAWARLGLLAECRRWCETALAKLGPDADPQLAAPVYRALLMSMGSKDEIETIARAIPFSERAGDWDGVAVLTSRLALRYGERGRFEEAERAFARVWQIRENHGLGTAPRWATIWMHRGTVYRREDRLDEADAAITESLRLARALGKPLHEMWALLVAGEIAFARGDPRRAIALGRDALEICRANRHAVGEISSRTNLAAYHLAIEEIDEARAQALAAIAAAGETELHVAVSAILHAAAIEAVSGDAEAAGLLRGYVDAVRAREELKLEPTESSSYRILTSALERRLDRDRIAAFEKEGARLEYAQAVKLALAEQRR